MNAIEIESALSELSCAVFDATEFPYTFLAAFGYKDTALKRLRVANKNESTNASDIAGSILLRNQIHLTVCDNDTVDAALQALRQSPASIKAKAKFILATDGNTLQAEELASGEHIECDYRDFVNHFGFFLPLAGISTVKEIKDNPIDIRATSKLNRLYLELLKTNPDWAKPERRADMNHFMARLIFCFFAEDTDIFNGDGLFIKTIDQMSMADGSNTHTVIETIFQAMNTAVAMRAADLPLWAGTFPYVNGGLFSGNIEVPRFSRMARNYFLNVGVLHWRQINPDIFGSMIQAVADDNERGALGMHYTSVPNILKVLNPLFLDDLRHQLAIAGDNTLKLLNLRKRMACIRVFDPACGSGNFLVIAYKQLRGIEAIINEKRGESHLASSIPITNFRGIELRDFPAEIARLALIIAEFQCDVLYRGQKDALLEFLPLNAENWITCGNALRIDWLSICPPTGTGVKLLGDDLFNTPLDQTEIDFVNEGGETYICGNPPYLGSTWQSAEQKDDLKAIFDYRCKNWKSLDYVAGWFMKAADYGKYTPCVAAFVSTNSICQGSQVPILWPLIFDTGSHIAFAHTSFKWKNLASHNAVVTVAIVAIGNQVGGVKRLFSITDDGTTLEKQTDFINAYLLPSKNIFVKESQFSIGFDAIITDGSGALDGGHLILDNIGKSKIEAFNGGKYSYFIKPYLGSSEFIRGNLRYCLWIEDKDLEEALSCKNIAALIQLVRKFRENAGTRAKTAINRSHKFAWINKRNCLQILIPTVFSENREYVTAGYLSDKYIISNAASIVQDAKLYIFAIISSKIHMSWVQAIAGTLGKSIRYTSATCYNTFPVPFLTDKNKTDLTRCAENILLAREAHFPATIAELYEVKDGVSQMPENLRRAHEENDETLERIYIGRRFKNDTERLEKLFELYTKMTHA